MNFILYKQCTKNTEKSLYYEDYMLYFFAFFGICSFIVLKNDFHCNNKIKKYKNTNYFLFYRVIPFLKTSRVKKVA